ncbi:hypothetical protein [Polaromonas sp.]|uniref:hypothetical protein n=1 Tax=Polaromonas sp. TaxID=1869339 RepID=UPI00352453A2
MLDAALERQRPVHFIHCARNKSVHAFRDALATRQARHAPLRHFYVHDEHAGETDRPHATGLIDSGHWPNGCRLRAMWMPISWAPSPSCAGSSGSCANWACRNRRPVTSFLVRPAHWTEAAKTRLFKAWELASRLQTGWACQNFRVLAALQESPCAACK